MAAAPTGARDRLTHVMTRVLHITDTHISPVKRHFHGNWGPLRDWAARVPAELVIHTGDVAVDGAGEDSDLSYCSDLMRELGKKVLVLPGNHDVGDGPATRQPVNDARLARWRRHFGEDRWVEDTDGWRLIGFDALLCGSGHSEEARQLAWLEHETKHAGGRRLAWFLHKPLFINTPDEPDTGYWSVKPEPRMALMDLVRRHDVALVASGHLHKWRDFSLDGTRYVWAPSSGFVCGLAEQPAWIPGEARLGALSYDFTQTDVDVRLHAIDGLVLHVIDDVVHEVYPRPAAA